MADIKAHTEVLSKSTLVFHVKSGDDYSSSRKKYVHLHRIIDKENDQYEEIVKDKETDEIIHQCSEPLKQHQGHGNAKSQKSDKESDNE